MARYLPAVLLLITCSTFLDASAERAVPHGGSSSSKYDVIVVGGGVSGLTAARNLLRVGKRVALLEARPEVGGRSERRAVAHSDGAPVECTLPQCNIPGSKVDGKWWFDLGGMWLGRTHERFLAMAQEYGVQYYDAAQVQGQLKLYINGLPAIISPGLLEGAKASAEDLRQLSPGQLASLKEFNRLAGELMKVVNVTNLEEPWNTPGARELDAMTFETWLHQNSEDRFAKDMLTWLYPLNHGLAGGLKPSWVSVLGAARLLKTGPLEDSEKWLFWGGAGQFVEHLSEEVTRRGGHIQVSSPVRHITQGPDGVTVRSDGGTFHAQYAILAMPPHLTGRITYDPPPPARRSQLAQRAAMGSVVKMLAFYASPFWRGGKGVAEGVTTGINPDPDKPVSMVFDASPPFEGAPGVLAGFLFADHALDIPAKGPAAVREAALSAFAEYLGDPAVAEPLNFAYVDWNSEQWTGGAYAAFLPPGGLTSFAQALWEPMGRIHWAGTEAAKMWTGYYEGAITSGEEAAAKVSQLLNKRQECQA